MMGAAPFTVSVSTAGETELLFQSRPFLGIFNKRAYWSRAKVTGADGQVIATHEQWIWFDIPQALKSEYATKILP
jgi:hypothetical protein